MNKTVKLLLLIAVFLLATSIAQSQKRGIKGAPNRSTTSSLRIYCKGETIPKGFVVLGYKSSSAKCGENSELVIKKPADSEIVCASSPIPEGYHVVDQKGSTACSTVDSNPLVNALTIVRDGSGIAELPKSVPLQSAPTRSQDDDDFEMAQATTKLHQVERRIETHQLRSMIEKQPKREEIEIAVRRATVIIGIEMQDVSRAWGNPRSNNKLIEEDGMINIWTYNRGEVYFRNGVVYKIALLKGN